MGKYLPHFQYQLVTLQDFSNEGLLAKGDEISLAMLINRIQTFEDSLDERQAAEKLALAFGDCAAEE